MDPAVVGAFSAILGSAVGGCASIATAWITHRTQVQRELMRTELSRREQLYAEFIAECSRLFIDALDHALDHPEKLLQAYAILNRIRLFSPESVLAAAERTVRQAVTTYLEPNLTIEEIHAHIARDVDPLRAARDVDSSRAGRKVDPLHAFSEAARADLRALQASGGMQPLRGNGSVT